MQVGMLYLLKEIFNLVSRREEGVCSFLEGGKLVGGSDYRLIYRHYATLYFIFCVDSSESELGILDLIQVRITYAFESIFQLQVLVEVLDRCFENVCELDLIFHMDKVHFILNEMIMGGMVLGNPVVQSIVYSILVETSLHEIVSRYHEQEKICKQEVTKSRMLRNHQLYNFKIIYLLSVQLSCL